MPLGRIIGGKFIRNNMNLTNLIDPRYWFNLDIPAILSPFGYGVIAFFSALIIIGFVMRWHMVKNASNVQDKKAKRALSYWFLTIGIIGGFLVFFSYENIRLLGSRVMYLILGLTAIVWMYFLIRYIKVTLPAKAAAKLASKEKDKYLPRKKK